ncbi:MAG: class I SAM-dependent methyltransferase, partial [Gammaproteobacteria bacterium]
ATGSGQAAVGLAAQFESVLATDASENQIAQCPTHPRISFQVASAEQAPLADHSVDLITVAQALHWFDLEAFYREARRVLKPHGVLAVWSYKLLHVSPQVDAVIDYYYRDLLGPYWPPERQRVEQGYAPLPADFRALDLPAFAMVTDWQPEQLLGYLGTWSAGVYYRQALQHDPLQHIKLPLARAWGNPTQQRRVTWPLQLRVGRLALEA